MSVCIDIDNFNNKDFSQRISIGDQASQCTQTKTKKWHLTKKLNLWIARSRQRKVLSSLNNSLLVDIGYTPAQAKEEWKKPFWK